MESYYLVNMPSIEKCGIIQVNDIQIMVLQLIEN